MANIHIANSWNVPKRQFGYYLDLLRKELPESSVWKRSYFSLKTEWATHNALYFLGIRRLQTISVDLNHPQKLWEKILYPIVGCVVWPFIP